MKLYALSFLSVVTLVAFEESFQQESYQDSAECKNVGKAFREQAERGDGNALMALTALLLESRCFDDAQLNFMKLLVRTRQDVACCTDPSTSSAIGSLKFAHATHVESLGGSKVWDDTSNSLQNMKKAVAWAEDLTNKNALPGPEWVGQFGMNVFIGNQGKELFIPINECQKKRLEVIQNYKEMLKNEQKK